MAAKGPSWKFILPFFSWTKKQTDLKLGRKIVVICKSKTGKIIPIGNPRCPPWWLSYQGGHALWKTGKMVKKIPCRDKIREFEILLKIRENQGISKNLIFVKSKYLNFIAVQMWLLVVSFCHMLKIPADLILLKGGVLVRWSTCLLYILTAFESVYDF